MAYKTVHKGIEIEYITNPDGSIELKINPAFVPLEQPIEIKKITVNNKEIFT
jgi:hypothetical protein